MSLLLLFNQGSAASAVSQAGGIASVEAFGAAQLNFRVFPAAIASLESFGAASTRFAVTPASIASGEVFGAAAAGFTIRTASIGSVEAFGTASAAFRLAPSAIPSLEAWGGAQLNLRVFLAAAGSAETFGATTALQASPQTIAAATIASAEAFGSTFIGEPPREQYFPPPTQGVQKPERLPRVIPATPRPRRVGAIGMPTAEAFGEPSLSISRAPQVLAAIALQPNTRIGAPALERAPSARQLRDEQDLVFDLAA